MGARTAIRHAHTGREKTDGKHVEVHRGEPREDLENRCAGEHGADQSGQAAVGCDGGPAGNRRNRDRRIRNQEQVHGDDGSIDVDLRHDQHHRHEVRGREGERHQRQPDRHWPDPSKQHDADQREDPDRDVEVRRGSAVQHRAEPAQCVFRFAPQACGEQPRLLSRKLHDLLYARIELETVVVRLVDRRRVGERRRRVPEEDRLRSLGRDQDQLVRNHPITKRRQRTHCQHRRHHQRRNREPLPPCWHRDREQWKCHEPAGQQRGTRQGGERSNHAGGDGDPARDPRAAGSTAVFPSRTRRYANQANSGVNSTSVRSTPDQPASFWYATTTPVTRTARPTFSSKTSDRRAPQRDDRGRNRQPLHEIDAKQAVAEQPMACGEEVGVERLREERPAFPSAAPPVMSGPLSTMSRACDS